jgi:hypothetical protein
MSDFPTHIIRDLRHPALHGEEKGVFFAMADRLQSTDGLVWASIGTIAQDAGVSTKTAQRVITWAVSVGVLAVVVEGGRRSYRFDFERLRMLPADVNRNRRALPKMGPSVPSGGPTVPPSSPASTGLTVPDVGLSVLDLGPTVPQSRTHGPTKVQEKDTKKELLKDSAREAPRDASGLAAPKKRTPDPRASRWPDDFELDAEMIAYATDRGMNGPKHAADEFERFKNYHQSKGSKFVVWKLAWYTWVRNWDDRRNRGAPGQRPTRMTSMQSEGSLFEPGNGASDMAKVGW